MRTARMLAIGAFLAVTLAGCSAEPPPDANEVQAWLNEQSAQAGDSLGQLGGLAAAELDAEVSASKDGDDGVRLDYAEPVLVASLEFSCFGAATMSVEAQVETASSYLGASAERVRCDDGPLPIDIDSGSSPVTAVTAHAESGRGFGAWSVVVR